MSNIPWYQVMFQNYSRQYDKESFTKGTLGECDFVEKELQFNKALSIIDVGCGTGRHSIELSKRGYRVTGIDLSDQMLARAREKAEEAGVVVGFFQHDARNLPYNQQFDIAIMLCEGGFSLMETDELNFEILKSVARALKKPSKFIFTTLNGLFPLTHSINDFHTSESGEGVAEYDSKNFDLLTLRDYNLTRFVNDDGQEMELECNERYYMPSEITWLLKSLGFNSIEFFGAKLGAFSRSDSLTTGDFEMLVIAER